MEEFAEELSRFALRPEWPVRFPHYSLTPVPDTHPRNPREQIESAQPDDSRGAVTTTIKCGIASPADQRCRKEVILEDDNAWAQATWPLKPTIRQVAIRKRHGVTDDLSLCPWRKGA